MFIFQQTSHKWITVQRTREKWARKFRPTRMCPVPWHHKLLMKMTSLHRHHHHQQQHHQVEANSISFISYSISFKYNLLFDADCWRFGNRCCLHRNDCPPGVATASSRCQVSLFVSIYEFIQRQFYFQCAVVVIGVVAVATNGLVLYALLASKQHRKHVLIVNQNALDLFGSFFLAVIYSLNLCNVYLTGSTGYWLCVLFLSESLLLCKIASYNYIAIGGIVVLLVTIK